MLTEKEGTSVPSFIVLVCINLQLAALPRTP